MTDMRAGELLSQNLTAIYGFAFARLYDKDRVDDLTGEIIYEIMISAGKIKDDAAFWGYVWRVADNTFRRFIRRGHGKACDTLSQVPDAVEHGLSPEQEYIEREQQQEQLYLLRRELSLLTRVHREVCVAYYVGGMSCSEIASQQNISVDMVKYHLFKTRKLLKEGIGMTRTLGEKSYNPGTFRLNFWGDRNHYGGLFTRKLPGSIMLAAYYTPMTAQELSVEVGVSMPYLEDELEIFQSAGLISSAKGKYQTNIVIITEEYERELGRLTANIYAGAADSVYREVAARLADIRSITFDGNDYDNNRLLFALLNIAMVNGYSLARERAPIGPAKALPLGGHGWLFGHDNDISRSHFRGVCMEVWNRSGTAWFSAENYRIIDRAQLYDHSHFDAGAEAMCTAVLGGAPDWDNVTLTRLLRERFVLCEGDRLSANFPVFDSDAFERVCGLLAGASEQVCDCMMRVSDTAQGVLSEHVPTGVRPQCGDVAKIYHRQNVMAYIMEELVADGRLTVPDEKTPLCVWGVRAGK